jgi:hypothetical protein
MAKSTMKELVTELELRQGLSSAYPKPYEEIIAEAKAGEYHDYKNNKYTCGKMELVVKLKKFPALDDIREAVINGEYDEEMDEDDKLAMKAQMVQDMGITKAEALFKRLKLD